MVLAFSENRRSAAIAADGRLLAAVTAPSTQGGSAEGLGAGDDAVELCLRQTSLRRSDLSMVAQVNAHERGLPGVVDEAGPVVAVSHQEAQLMQASLVAGDTALLVVADDTAQPEVFIGRMRDGSLETTARCPSLTALLYLRRQLAAFLGLCDAAGTRQLEQLAEQGDPEFVEDLRTTLRSERENVVFDQQAFTEVVERVERRSPGPLRDPAALHRGVLHVRAALAASVRALVVDGFAAMASDNGLPSASVQRLGAAGSFFLVPSLNTAIDRAVGGNFALTPVPESCGAVLGAALKGSSDGQRIRHLALGPTFGEQDIKRVLENCRLEYLYEPDWSRLMARVSGLLAAGRAVAWYQEPLDFGPRSLGSRSILCDPSHRYARENINSYLLRRSIDEPLPLSVPQALAAICFEESVDSPFMLFGAHVRANCEARLAAAIYGARTCTVHTVDDAGHPRLRELLQVHHARTGVPGLINVGLCDFAGALAVTPREAVRAAFGSAVDVLVLGRFIVSKDYWLLRSDVATVETISPRKDG